ncbi:unnamed protein product [Acanthoscelides obtectus]|uniref:Major facilitator superfamily (MFS) profile domain-containing protein n=1 Tax=Acanthoscelides obtectus TaxID=200917 RepID=A0A9P0P4F4_ACAOB|nr:unnamed protein product [Acanthoscelides obtectus]CAK1655501.1 Facilitated trehalose transporter Tret1 [Acanthoscelides obtectus]
MCLNMRVYQYMAGAGSNFGMISVGMHYGWSSIALPKLINGTETSFTITPEDASWLASIVSLGSLFGDTFALLTLDKLGRKFLIIGSSLPLAVSWLLVANAQSVAFLYIGRLLGGLADGIAFSVVPPYLTEISDPEIRGFLGSTYPVTLHFGMLLMNILELIFSIQLSSYLACLIGMSTLLIMPLVPDSPYFHLLKGNEKAAKESLQKFTGKKDVSKDLERILEGMQEEGGAHLNCSKAFFSPLAIKALMISIGLIFLQQMNGLLAVISYTSSVFQESKDFLDPQVSNIIFYSMLMLCALLGAFLVDIFGRKFLILLSLISSTIMLLITGAYIYIKTETSIDVEGMGYVELISVILYAVSEGVGLIFIPLLVVSEILPTNVKAVGMLLINICFALTSATVIKFFSWSSMEYGMYVPFFTFALCGIAGVIFVICLVPETKGKTLEEVHRAIDGHHKNKSYDLD